jgi:hypothetical protein
MEIVMNDGAKVSFAPVKITPSTVAVYSGIEDNDLKSIVELFNLSLKKTGKYDMEQIDEIFEKHLDLVSQDEGIKKNIQRVVQYITTGAVPVEK